MAAVDLPPPGAGFTTVTEAVPAVATSVDWIDAVNCVLLTKVVARGDPFHWTLKPFTKLLPLTVSVNPA